MSWKQSWRSSWSLLSSPAETVSYLKTALLVLFPDWNDTCSHVLSPVFTVVEAKCGILRPESTTCSEDSTSDSNTEDAVETFPKPSPWFEGICQPAFPSPEPVPKLLKSVAGLGPTKVSGSVCNSSLPVLVHIPFPWSLWRQKGSHHRNRSPQSHDVKWCDNKSHTCAWFGFINIGILSIPLWKYWITKHWGKTTRWMWGRGGGRRGRFPVWRTRWV